MNLIKSSFINQTSIFNSFSFNYFVVSCFSRFVEPHTISVYMFMAIVGVTVTVYIFDVGFVDDIIP